MIELIGFGEKGWGALLLMATLMTLAVTASAIVIGAVCGTAVAAAKLSQPALRMGNAYTTVFRGVPELLIIYLILFGTIRITSVGGVDMTDFWACPFKSQGAGHRYHLWRLSGRSLPRRDAAEPAGELEAAASIGMNRATGFRRSSQVLRLAIPGVGNVQQ